MTRTKRILIGVAALLIAACIWVPCLHFFFHVPASDFHGAQGLSPQARALAARHLQLWTEPALREQELHKMRASNAEWDFMGRSFLVWSLANMGLREPASKPTYLATIDQIIDETVRLEKQEGMYFFLMPYAKASHYVAQPPHSLFLDGEIAMMLASRRLLEEKPEYKPLLAERVNAIVERFQQSPRMVLESYPDECWMFDHVVALATIRMADTLDGSDHSALIRDWIAMAKQKLLHKESGLLLTSFTTELAPLDGPEGSTLWMVAHCLQLLDENFAREQYEIARRELGRTSLGFSYAREWPSSWNGPADIDWGPIIPVFEISAGSSGMAFIGASSFGDDRFLSSLATTLQFAAFPSRKDGQLKYCASNQVGDAALLYTSNTRPTLAKSKRSTKSMTTSASSSSSSASSSAAFSEVDTPRAFSLRRLWRAEFLSPKDLTKRAMLITLVYTIARAAGLKEFTTVLNGTMGSVQLGFGISAFLGLSYVFVYLAFVLLVPILLLAAVMLAAWKRFR